MKILYVEPDGKTNKQEIDCNDDVSFKDFSGRPQFDRNLVEFDGKIVYASNFSQKTPDTFVFPKDMKGVTFVKCNLDNVIVPEGNTVLDCSQKRYQAQNDLNDWIVNEAYEPLMPVNHKQFTKRGLSVPTPDMIPLEKPEKPIDWVEKVKKMKEVKSEEVANILEN